ncbi:lipoprotein [Arthrobacter sp. PAMC 25486]|uniref:zinc metallochaperone AztD n=1 Tax=Arthrobacter sp. PAMC 25486 TaxID=1494608 RepID=UPI000535CD85|nr:zinc metallochaperone AztD [Arthrobacter sp. PAMC 25486]AIY03201.1 lipoprotein [Arthrobacter sp. PAMC 25486]
MLHHRRTRLAVTAFLAGIALMASACGNASGTADSTAEASSTSSSSADAHGRVAVSYEGGISVLDGATLEVVKSFDSEEFTRLNAAGDGRHVFVTTTAGFQLLDMAEPKLTDLVFDATAPGHVVRHAGNTVLFDDGTGTATIVKSEDLATVNGSLPQTRTYTADAAHHGVSIVLEDGTLLTTLGDKSSRPGAVALEAHEDHWHSVAQSKECPGIHGEGAAADEAVVFGCEDGALLYHHGKFEKFTAPDTYGRMGNAFVSETSPIVVGDYKNDPDAEGYLLNSVALIDTEKHSYNVVELPDTVNYTFRDVARGPGDLAYILSTNGSIHVLDPKDGKIVDEFPVIKAWEGPTDWQDAHPAIMVNGDTAYITEPAAHTVHSVDLTTGKITVSKKMDVVPNEIAVTVGAH